MSSNNVDSQQIHKTTEQGPLRPERVMPKDNADPISLEDPVERRPNARVRQLMEKADREEYGDVKIHESSADFFKSLGI